MKTDTTPSSEELVAEVLYHWGPRGEPQHRMPAMPRMRADEYAVVLARRLAETMKALEEADARTYPETLTPDLETVLGTMCFQVIEWAQIWRAAGVEIEKRAEAEQAFFLDVMLRCLLKRGSKWRDAFYDLIKEKIEAARTRAERVKKEGE